MMALPEDASNSIAGREATIIWSLSLAGASRAWKVRLAQQENREPNEGRRALDIGVHPVGLSNRAGGGPVGSENAVQGSKALSLVPFSRTEQVRNRKKYIIRQTMKQFSYTAFFIGSKERTILRTHALWLVSVLSAFWAASALPAQTVAPSPTAPAAKGTPRLASGHPCTLWDDQDVAAYRASFTTNPGLKAAIEELQAWGNKRVTEPFNVPTHKVEADGTWTFPAFKRGYQDVSGKWNWEWNFNSALQRLTADVSDLGVLYALTGDENYAVFARQILLALADAYGHGKGSIIPDPQGYDHFEAYGFDGGDIGMFLAKACHGYDLIYNLPSLSAEDRTHIERDLIRPLAEHLKKFTFMYTSHRRWGMVCLYGLFVAGVDT